MVLLIPRFSISLLSRLHRTLSRLLFPHLIQQFLNLYTTILLFLCIIVVRRLHFRLHCLHYASVAREAQTRGIGLICPRKREGFIRAVDIAAPLKSYNRKTIGGAPSKLKEASEFGFFRKNRILANPRKPRATGNEELRGPIELSCLEILLHTWV